MPFAQCEFFLTPPANIFKYFHSIIPEILGMSKLYPNSSKHESTLSIIKLIGSCQIWELCLMWTSVFVFVFTGPCFPGLWSKMVSNPICAGLSQPKLGHLQMVM
jgi:hypothetical protein